MDWTIVVFWALVGLFVLVIFWFLKKYLGRILLLCLFFALLCGVFYRLNPSLVEQSWKTVKALPYTLHRAEKSELDDVLPAVELDVPQMESEILVENQDQEERQYSWFASFFGFGKSSDDENSENSEVVHTGSAVAKTEESQTLVVSPVQEVVKAPELVTESLVEAEKPVKSEEIKGAQATGEILAAVEKTLEKAESTTKIEEKRIEELVLDPSEYTVSIDAKGMIVIRLRDESADVALPLVKEENKVEKKQVQAIITQPTSKKQLSDQDLREANEIFNL